jgi:hypothetical protein
LNPLEALFGKLQHPGTELRTLGAIAALVFVFGAEALSGEGRTAEAAFTGAVVCSDPSGLTLEAAPRCAHGIISVARATYGIVCVRCFRILFGGEASVLAAGCGGTGCGSRCASSAHRRGYAVGRC